MEESSQNYQPYSNERKNIQKLANELAEELVDKDMLQKYGTSMESGMRHDYVKKLEKKYYQLKSEFHQIDTNDNGELTFDELYNFFKDRKLPGTTQNIDENYIKRLLFLMDRDKSKKITIEEFVFSYIKLEEKLNIKSKKLKMLSDSLKDSLKQYEEKKEKTKNEKLNKDGICENASLSITLFEAKDLQPYVFGTEPDTFVAFSLEGKQQHSNLQTNSVNPVYNEDFTFPITKRGEVLKIEVYEQGTLTGKQIIGQVSIDLVLLEHQQKTENWYSLSITGKNPDECGSIHLRLRYIYNWNKYYTDLVSKTKVQINRLQEDIDELDKYQALFQEPFGIISAGEVNSIIEKRMFEKSEDVLDYIASTRRSIYVSRPSNTQNKIVYIHEGGEIAWKRETKILMLVCLILSLFTFFSRTDFLSTLVVLGLINLMIRKNKTDFDKPLNVLIFGLEGSIGFDILWILFSFLNWKSPSYENKKVLFLTFLFSLANFFAKIILVFMVLKVRANWKKKRDYETDNIMKNNLS